MPSSRRSFLGASGVAAVAAVAGCTDLRNALAPAAPVEAVVREKRLDGALDDHMRPLFVAHPAEGTHTLDPDAAPVAPEVTVERTWIYREDDGLPDVAPPETSLVVEGEFADRLDAAFDRLLYRIDLCLRERDPVADLDAGWCSHYVSDREQFNRVRPGDAVRFRPRYGDDYRIMALEDVTSAHD